MTTETLEKETGVCVVGGGPAGSTIARQLALLGHEVCLVEQSAYARWRTGESLPPSILPLLHYLGMRAHVEDAQFLRPAATIVRWSGDGSRLKVEAGPRGFLINRERFDQVLLKAARDVGVEVLQPARALRPQLMARERASPWRVPIQHQGQLRCIKASYLVDATGRRAVTRGRRQCLAPAMVALYGHWSDVWIAGIEARVEAGAEEWFWGAPLPGGMFAAVVFLDPSFCRRAAGKLEDLYRSLLSGSTLLRRCLAGKLEGGVRLCDASTYAAECPVNERLIRIGEACLSIDPLSSQGIQEAMRSGLQGSVVVNTLLRRPGDGDAALRFYRRAQAQTFAHHSRLAAQYYGEVAVSRSHHFWRARARWQDENINPRPSPIWCTLEAYGADDITQMVKDT